MEHDCPYYELHVVELRCREIRADRMDAPPIVSTTPWCSHPNHSPKTLRSARSISNKKLECGGVLDNCPLTAEQFNDA